VVSRRSDVAGRRQKDFRSGDLNEELGILLLKHVAVVANVPRPEDVGIDAVATLLREDGDLLIAESSFYVQFKSASCRSVTFKGHEVRWLEKLKLPFMIGSVSTADGTIALYAGHFLSRALVEQTWDEIELILDEMPNTRPGPPSESVRTVYAGPPLLRWSLADVSNAGTRRHAYDCLKPYLAAEQWNIDHRGIRYYDVIEWDTGQPTLRQYGSCILGASDGSDVLPVLRAMTPHLLALLSRAWSDRDRAAVALVRQLVAYMRAKGFDPDPNDTTATIERHWDGFQDPRQG
jgi:hypothetical protein